MTNTPEPDRVAQLEQQLAESNTEREHLRKQVRTLAARCDELRRNRVVDGLRELRDAMTWSKPAPKLSIDEGTEP